MHVSVGPYIKVSPLSIPSSRPEYLSKHQALIGGFQRICKLQTESTPTPFFIVTLSILARELPAILRFLKISNSMTSQLLFLTRDVVV